MCRMSPIHPHNNAESLEMECRIFERRLLTRRAARDYAAACPGERYVPHSICSRGPRKGRPSGQDRFHQSPHIVRGIATGNGWGGTVAMAAEWDAWARHTDRWQPTPRWPVIGVWFCEDYRQLSILMANLRSVAFGTIPTMHTSGFGGPRMVWPDGSILYFCSYNRGWTHIQGIELDLAIFDEQPPLNLWMEMQQRRRGKRKTRYVFKATQTRGWSWMADAIYRPWRDWHIEHGGHDNDEAAQENQTHPTTWLWCRGGIYDNPHCDEQDDRHYESQPWSSRSERDVRLHGGFRRFTTDPVFDEDAMDRLLARSMELMAEVGPGRCGSLVLQRRGE